MNPAKAKQHFSAYYEGTLDRGLKESFERALHADAQLQAEYRAFKRTMEDLDSLQNLTIAVPNDLHDRIAARIDKQVWEEKRKQTSGLSQWWRSLAFGGLAVVAIAGAIISVNRNSGDTTGSGVVPVAATSPVFEVARNQDGLVLTYQRGEGEVVVRDASGNELKRIVLGDKRVESPLTNPNAKPNLLIVELEKPPRKAYVVVPGKQPEPMRQGEGTLLDMAKAVSSTYNVPVIVVSNKSEIPVKWNFVGDDIPGAVNQVVENAGLNVTQRNSNIVWIEEQ